MTNAAWWARVVQARTEHADLLPQRVWVLRKDSQKSRSICGLCPVSALKVTPLRFTAVIDGQRRGYRFTGAIALDRIVAAPTGTGHNHR